MIDSAINFITQFVNTKIRSIFDLNEDKVVASSLINPDGSVTDYIENKIIISLINIEHETYAKSPGTYVPIGNNQYGKIEQPVYLNLYLLFSANYTAKNYLEALKMLSAAIAILQSNQSFDITNNPDLDLSIRRLTLEIHNVPINELSHIWSGIGAKYVPSIIYKVRMIAIQQNLIKSTAAAITELDTTSDPGN